MGKAEYQINYIDPQTGQIATHGGSLEDMRAARKDLERFREDFPGVMAWIKIRLVSGRFDAKEENGSDS